MQLFEIEQKFSWDLTKYRSLTSNDPLRPFRLKYTNFLKFRDTYYDHQGKLSKAGLWVRKRQYLQKSGQKVPNAVYWEAKVALPGSTYNNSAFQEIQEKQGVQEESKISALIRVYHPEAKGPEEDFGLKVLADFVTERLQYHIQDNFRYDRGSFVDFFHYFPLQETLPFTMVLDETDFGHRVGEIELVSGDPKHAHWAIDNFMKRNSWFFNTHDVRGKLSAYFDWKKSQDFALASKRTSRGKVQDGDVSAVGSHHDTTDDFSTPSQDTQRSLPPQRSQSLEESNSEAMDLGEQTSVTSSSDTSHSDSTCRK